MDPDTTATTKRFLTRLWNLENDERPGFLIGYAGPKVKGGRPVRSALFSTEGKDTVRERLLDPARYLAAQLEEIGESTLCILCAACTSACPSLWPNPNYLGPAALLKAYRFVFDSRDDGADERLDIVNDKNGIWRCHTIFNCMDACPKKIKITHNIGELKKRVIAEKY